MFVEVRGLGIEVRKTDLIFDFSIKSHQRKWLPTQLPRRVRSARKVHTKAWMELVGAQRRSRRIPFFPRSHVYGSFVISPSPALRLFPFDLHIS